MSNIDRDKIVGYLNGITANWVGREHLIDKINSGEFDCEEIETRNVKFNNSEEVDACTVNFSDKSMMKETIAEIKDRDKTEAVKSEWKPKVGDRYYFPFYIYGIWEIRNDEYWGDEVLEDEAVVKAKEAFKTESDCKRYMNAKGWYNDKQWEVEGENKN